MSAKGALAEDSMRVVFVIPSMKIGGTRTSLLNLLKLLPHDRMEADLVILSPVGPYMDRIDPRVNVIDAGRAVKAAYSPIGELSLPLKAAKLWYAGLNRLFGRERAAGRAAASLVKRLAGRDYDAAIGFQEGDALDFSALIPAKKHFCWIHNDFSVFGQGMIGSKKSFDRMDGIFFVADSALESFDKGMPGYRDKLEVIRNTLDAETIVEKGREEPEGELRLAPYGGLNIVSVGRVSAQKAFERVLYASRALTGKGVSHTWTVIGEGEERPELVKRTEAEGLADKVFFPGAKANPYPFIKRADVLAVTSRYESQPMVVLEALSLGTPVVSTDFSSAKELLDGKDYAVICENSEEGVAEGLCEAAERLGAMKTAAAGFRYDNEEIINEIIRHFS